MIFNTSKNYAKVWEVKPNDKYIDIRMTTSEKDKDGKYVNSTWFARLIGHAFNTMKDKIKAGDRITITKSKMTNETQRTEDGNYKTWFRFLILEASFDEAPQTASETASTTASTTGETPASNDDSPW